MIKGSFEVPVPSEKALELFTVTVAVPDLEPSMVEIAVIVRLAALSSMATDSIPELLMYVPLPVWPVTDHTTA
jgi:hypothetical protein